MFMLFKTVGQFLLVRLWPSPGHYNSGRANVLQMITEIECQHFCVEYLLISLSVLSDTTAWHVIYFWRTRTEIFGRMNLCLLWDVFPSKRFTAIGKKVLISWREPRLLWPVGWNWSNDLQIISLCYSYTMCHWVVTREIILFRLKTASWISIKRLWVRCNCWLFKYVFFL